MSAALEIVIVLLLIVLNGVFSMSELAVMSSRRARLQQRANEGSIPARAALDLSLSPNRFLSTVQIGITLVGVLAGAFGGATISGLLSDQFAQVDWLARYSDALGLGLVVLVITYLSLVIGELVPKRLALQNPEQVAMIVAQPMNMLSMITGPLVKLLTTSTNVVVRLLGVQKSDEPPITEEEIRILLEEGTQAGVFRTTEQDMVESIFRLDNRLVSSLMTPHTEMLWLDVDAPPDTIKHTIMRSGHSAFLVGRGSLDNLAGLVRVHDLLAACFSGEPLTLEKHLRRAHFIPENASASKAVELFKEIDDRILVVIDEYGGIQGLVTEYDILEAIVGTMPGQPDVPQAVQREDGSWLMDGLLTIDEVKDRLHLRELPGEERGTYHTLGGFVMSQIGQIPTTGQLFEAGGLRFEVVDMDGRRVDKVLVMAVPESPSAGDDQP